MTELFRAFVVGDRVIGAMRRVAQGDEFRSNVHRGGKVEAVRLEEAYEKTAVRAAQIMGLRVAGVDNMKNLLPASIRKKRTRKIEERSENPGA